MLTFISNIKGTSHYPVADIAKIGARRAYSNSPNTHYFEVELRDGTQVYVDEHQIDDLMNPVEHCIPAVPGYSVVHADDPDDKPLRTPVIAWAFRRGGEIAPITVEGENDGMFRSVLVELPTGQVHSPDEQALYDNLDYFVRARRAEAERAAKPPPAAETD